MTGHSIKVVVDYDPSQVDNAVVSEGIIASNAHILGERDKAFSIFLKNDSGKVFGGIQAFLDTESVYIDVLWVEEKLQKKGYGGVAPIKQDHQHARLCTLKNSLGESIFKAL